MAIIWALMPYRIYRISGDDAEVFLQGQLTQDMTKIQFGNCHYGAYCSHKGRMFANFLLSRDTQGAFVVRLHEQQADSVIQRLTMFKLRSKVSIETLSVTCLAGNQAMAEAICQQYDLPLPELFNTSSNNDVMVFSLPNGYYEVMLSEGCENPFVEESSQFDAVEALRLRSGNFHILAATTESILPQQTPLEQWGGISYDKGCYVGQEIIARNKYLGKVKKGLAAANIDSVIDCEIGQIVEQDGKSVGKVIEYHQGDSQTTCLVLLSLSSMGQPSYIGGVPVIFHAIN